MQLFYNAATTLHGSRAILNFSDASNLLHD